MKKYLKLIVAMAFTMSFSAQAFATDELNEDADDLVMNEEAVDELAMSKKSSADNTEYDYRGNPVNGKAKRKKGSYPSPMSKENTSSSAEEEVDAEESVY